MSTKSVVAGINSQIQLEFTAAYTYLAMAAYFESENLEGFAHWMRVQHTEELGHAMRLFDFQLDHDNKVELKGIEKPDTAAFKSPLAVVKKALAHEQKVTASINDLYELALKEKDYPVQIEMQWFINEQAEEEKNVSDVIARLEMVGDNKAALLMMDREMNDRSSPTA